jgi:uncharacterized membrane protein
MIKDPGGVITVLLLIEGLIFFLSEHRRTRRLFDFVPSMFWIYFVPFLASTFRLIPADSAVYPFASRVLLPGSLILLLLAVDIRGILRLGWMALVMMTVGSLGIILGGPAVLFLFRPWLPEGIWSGFGALSASWTGGSANMVAVKEGMHTPERIYSLMVVVDSIIPYVWMTFLMAMARFQPRFDRWNRADTRVMDELSRRMNGLERAQPRPLTTHHTAAIFAVAFVGAWISSRMANGLPEVKGMIGTYTWTIILATTVGILLSFTGFRRLETHGASKIGYALLYFVLATYGARANVGEFNGVHVILPVLIAAGFVWVLIHGFFILVAARLLRAPLFLAAAASQANVGGVASAPVVAEAYQPSLASVGLLLAILGNIVGTYLGILCGQMCKCISGP